MAKTSYQLIPPEYDTLYSRVLSSGDRYTIPRVRRAVLYFSRRRIKGLTEKSLIPTLSTEWNNLDQSTRDLWNSAGAESALTGFKCFLKDKAARIRNELSGFATPSTLHQVNAGLLHIESPATEIKIEQLHPLNYWVQKKVTGTKNQYQPILITESFDLPIDVAISYKSSLTALGADSFAKFYALVYSHYQGRIIETPCEVNFSLSSGWTRDSASLDAVIGRVRGYTAFVEIFNCTGDLWIDNIEINHSAQNWCRDPYCNDIDQGFTKAFFQVPKHWNAVDIPDGAFFGSVYYN